MLCYVLSGFLAEKKLYNFIVWIVLRIRLVIPFLNQWPYMRISSGSEAQFQWSQILLQWQQQLLCRNTKRATTTITRTNESITSLWFGCLSMESRRVNQFNIASMQYCLKCRYWVSCILHCIGNLRQSNAGKPRVNHVSAKILNFQWKCYKPNAISTQSIMNLVSISQIRSKNMCNRNRKSPLNSIKAYYAFGE